MYRRGLTLPKEKKTKWAAELNRVKKLPIEEKLNVILEILMGFMSGLEE